MHELIKLLKDFHRLNFRADNPRRETIDKIIVLIIVERQKVGIAGFVDAQEQLWPTDTYNLVKRLWLCLWELWHSVINPTQHIFCVVLTIKSHNSHTHSWSHLTTSDSYRHLNLRSANCKPNAIFTRYQLLWVHLKIISTYFSQAHHLSLLFNNCWSDQFLSLHT